MNLECHFWNEFFINLVLSYSSGFISFSFLSGLVNNAAIIRWLLLVPNIQGCQLDNVKSWLKKIYGNYPEL